jgi:hypothetical protein
MENFFSLDEWAYGRKAYFQERIQMKYPVGLLGLAGLRMFCHKGIVTVG